VYSTGISKVKFTEEIDGMYPSEKIIYTLIIVNFYDN